MKKIFATESTESTEKSILWVRVRLRCFVAAALAAIFGAAELRHKPYMDCFAVLAMTNVLCVRLQKRLVNRNTYV